MTPQDATPAFAGAVAAYHDFFMLAGTAAATLLGLVFVALTLNPQAMADEQDAVVSAWSGQAYSNFLGVLLISLVGLVPDLDARTLGFVIGVSAVLGLGRAAFRLQQLRQHPGGTWDPGRLQFRLAGHAFGYLILAYVAVRALDGDVDSLVWMVPAVFLLIWAAMSGAWDLLGEMTRRAG